MKIIEFLATLIRHVVAAHCRRAVDAPMTDAELAAALDAQVKLVGEPLDWRHSVVDLLKAVRMDSALKARQQLAAELGRQGPFSGTADNNTWLRTAVLSELANHNISLPQ